MSKWIVLFIQKCPLKAYFLLEMSFNICGSLFEKVFHLGLNLYSDTKLELKVYVPITYGFFHRSGVFDMR